MQNFKVIPTKLIFFMKVQDFRKYLQQTEIFKNFYRRNIKKYLGCFIKISLSLINSRGFKKVFAKFLSIY